MSKISNIALKNDLFRKTFIGGRVMLTNGVNGSGKVDEILKAVREFNDFNEDNDPYKEHDFGKIVIDGEDYFFKIDYYDENYEYFQEDGNRVMTIMRADEY
jgi:hypothetical protein